MFGNISKTIEGVEITIVNDRTFDIELSDNETLTIELPPEYEIRDNSDRLYTNSQTLSMFNEGDKLLYGDRVNPLEVIERLNGEEITDRLRKFDSAPEKPIIDSLELEGPQGGYIRLDEYSDGRVLYSPAYSVPGKYEVSNLRKE